MSGYYGSQNPPNQSSDGSYYNDYYSQQQQQQQHGGNPYENQQQHQQNQQFYQQNQNYSNPYLNQPSHYGSQPQDQQFFQQQQQQPMNSFFNPATATAVAAAMANSGMSSDTMIDLAQGMGKNFLQNSTAKMIPGLESTMVMLRTYFAVDNKYVVQKMKKTLIPFLSKDWRRIVSTLSSYCTGLSSSFDLTFPLSSKRVLQDLVSLLNTSCPSLTQTPPIYTYPVCR